MFHYWQQSIQCDAGIMDKPTKAGTKAALLSLGYTDEPNYMPSALLLIQAAMTFTADEMAWARYLIYDTDFGGAWGDADQINMHLV